MSNASELHAFEIFKLQVKLINNQQLSEAFSTKIADSDLNEMMKEKSWTVCTNLQTRSDSNSLKCRVLVMLKMALIYNNSFFEDIRKIKRQI